MLMDVQTGSVTGNFVDWMISGRIIDLSTDLSTGKIDLSEAGETTSTITPSSFVLSVELLKMFVSDWIEKVISLNEKTLCSYIITFNPLILYFLTNSSVVIFLFMV